MRASRYVGGCMLRSFGPGSWAVEGTPYAIMASERTRQDGRGPLKGRSWWEAVDTSQGNLIVEGTTGATLTEAAEFLAAKLVSA